MNDSLDVNEWIRYAQMDYDAAKQLSLFRESFMEIVCYHCQQSAEKILKAYAIAQGEPLKKTHDLETLLEQCIHFDEQFAAFADICDVLTEYTIVTRYPPDEVWITENEMSAALKNASEILEFTKSKLAELGNKPKSE